MVRWHHQLNGLQFKQTLRESGGQGSLMRYNPRGPTESDVTLRLKNSDKGWDRLAFLSASC